MRSPEGMQAIFERLKGRPARPEEIAEFQQPLPPLTPKMEPR
jgi:hypothetical protein